MRVMCSNPPAARAVIYPAPAVALRIAFPSPPALSSVPVTSRGSRAQSCARAAIFPPLLSSPPGAIPGGARALI